MTGEASLQSLVERSSAADAAAFRDLMRELDQKLFRYLLSRTSSRDEAMDILQDTFVDIWYALPRFTYRSDEGFYRFLYTIVRRKLSRAGKQNTRALPDPDTLADDSFARDASRNADVACALQGLSATARDIVVLRHWAGYSFKEIGAIVSMKEEAVRVRHHRALATLRELLPAYA